MEKLENLESNDKVNAFLANSFSHLELDSKQQLAFFRRLKKFCLEFDPYNDVPTEDHKELLQYLGISFENEDPFTLTNKLLTVLTKVEDLLNQTV